MFCCMYSPIDSSFSESMSIKPNLFILLSHMLSVCIFIRPSQCFRFTFIQTTLLITASHKAFALLVGFFYAFVFCINIAGLKGFALDALFSGSYMPASSTLYTDISSKPVAFARRSFASEYTSFSLSVKT